MFKLQDVVIQVTIGFLVEKLSEIRSAVSVLLVLAFLCFSFAGYRIIKGTADAHRAQVRIQDGIDCEGN